MFYTFPVNDTFLPQNHVHFKKRAQKVGRKNLMESVFYVAILFEHEQPRQFASWGKKSKYHLVSPGQAASAKGREIVNQNVAIVTFSRMDPIEVTYDRSIFEQIRIYNYYI